MTSEGPLRGVGATACARPFQGLLLIVTIIFFLNDLEDPQRQMPAEWIEKIIRSRSEAEVEALVNSWPTPTGLPMVEELANEVVRFSRKDADATKNLAVASMLLASQLGQPRALGLARRAMGNAEQTFGNYRGAAAYYEEAIKDFEELQDEVEVGRTLSSLVGILSYLSEYDKALQYADRAKEIFDRHREEARSARLEVNLGNLYHRLDRFQEAIDCYQRALEVLAPGDDYEAIAGIKSNLATCLIVVNRFEDALKSYQEARAFCEDHQMPLLIAQADYNIAYLYYLRGQYTRSLELLSAATARFKELNNLQHLALCDLDQSEIYLELNMSRDAIELSEQASQNFQRLGMRYELAKAITITATAHAQSKNMFKALEIFEEARTMFEAEGNRVWVAMVDLYKATIFYSTGRHFEALDLCQRALSHFESQRLMTKAVYAKILLTKIFLALHDFEKAQQMAFTARTQLVGMNAPWLDYQCDYVLGLSQEALGNLEAAKKSYSEAIHVLETMRGNIIADELKITFFKDKLLVYERLISLSLQGSSPQEIAETYAYVERAKSRALVDLLSSGVGQVRRTHASSGEVVDHLQQLREELNWFYSKVNLEERGGKTESEGKITEMRELIRQREDQLMKILRQLPMEDEEYASLHSVVSVPLHRIQRSLKDNQLLVEFYVVQDRVVAFLLSSEEIGVVGNLADVARVKNEIDLLKYQLSKFNFGPSYVSEHRSYLHKSIDTHLADLYDSLLRPLADVLEGRDLIIIPHDFLHYVPFHALKTGDEYLIDRFTVSYSPSASVFSICNSKAPSANRRSLVMGVPEPRIPYVMDEVRDVAALLPNADLLVGEAATEEKLKTLGAEASALHIASHGVFRNDNPMFSSIQLGTSWLNLFDIYNIGLDADLVTLSGCGTGINRIVDGDELVGLVRGFLDAGSRSLLVSLWNVYDRSTAELMRSFYEFLRTESNIAVSLRRAMLTIKEHYPHPYYWAPFILMGKTVLPARDISATSPTTRNQKNN